MRGTPVGLGGVDHQLIGKYLADRIASWLACKVYCPSLHNLSQANCTSCIGANMHSIISIRYYQD